MLKIFVLLTGFRHNKTLSDVNINCFERSRVKGDVAEKCFESAPMKEETIVNN